MTTALRNSLVLGVGVGDDGDGADGGRGVDGRSGPASRGRRLIDQLAFSPLVIPGLVLGLGIAFVYLRSPLPIYGTLFILLIAYCTRYMPYGMRYAVSVMTQISSRAGGVGAGQRGQLVDRRSAGCSLPLLAPALLAGWVYIFVVSFRELSSSILLYSPGNEVLSILIWEQFENASFTVLPRSACSWCSALVVLVGDRLQGRRPGRACSAD